LNPRGYTWQKHLLLVWAVLAAGLIPVLLVGTAREQWVYSLALGAIGLTFVAWTQVGRPLWRGFWQGWRE
jgi:hypothetical protein